jgi:cellulose synthase/poly-beta-1,6-N-acetylglucosamine synthase-like glycosyltransferase
MWKRSPAHAVSTRMVNFARPYFEHNILLCYPVTIMSEPEISMIIPVYGVEPYIRRCLDSMLTQTFPDFECILVDDASPNNCPAIRCKYCTTRL